MTITRGIKGATGIRTSEKSRVVERKKCMSRPQTS